MEPEEAQQVLDRYAASNGSWGILYPSSQTLRFKCGACEDSGWLWDINRKVPCDVCPSGPAWLAAQSSQSAKDANDK